MNIKKSELKKALDKVKLFVDDKGINANGAYVHFVNENNRAMLFATDFIAAARAFFNTETADKFEFCISFNQLKSLTSLRGAEIVAEKFTDRENANGEKTAGIEFRDNKTKIVYSLHDSKDLESLEKKCNVTKIAETVKPIAWIGKDLKKAMAVGGYARNEKETQNLGLAGVKFEFKADGNVSLTSTDRTRIAVCGEALTPDIIDPVAVEGVMSDKTIRSLSSFDDEDNVQIFITDTQFVMVTKNLETFVPKINNNFPDVARFFEGEKELSYQVVIKDLLESLGVLAVANNEDICLEFTEKQLKLSTVNDGSYIEDFIDVVRTVGTEDKKLWVSTSLFTDIIKALSKEEKINFDFKSAIPAMGYSIEKKDNMDIYGILAPKRK